MFGLDRDSFDFYCENGIKEVIKDFCNTYSSVVVLPNYQELIWNEYVFFNEFCKREYMKESDHRLDRHKVVACYMYAIEKAHVLFVTDALVQGDPSNIMLNERLSFTVGMSLFRSLVLDLLDRVPVDNENKDRIRVVFEGDIRMPKCTHGDYKDNFLVQLYNTYREGNYNILLMADVLYMIECFNLVSAGLEEDILKYNPSV